MRWMLILLLTSGCYIGGPPRTQASFDAEKCRSYGLTPGTDAFGLCMQREAQARNQPIFGPLF